MEREILQIILALGWHVVYKQDDGSEYSFPLVYWALTRNIDNYNEVIGMDGGEYVDFAESMGNFARYEYRMPGSEGIDAVMALHSNRPAVAPESENK